MPRYFFDFDDEHSRQDDEGTECASPEAAEREARQTLAEVASDRFQSDGSSKQTVELLVRDDASQIVYRGGITLQSETFGILAVC